MALSDIFQSAGRTIREMPDVKRRSEKELIELQGLRDELAAQQGLRKLFAENANPSMTQIGQYSPKMAMEMPMMNLDIAAKQAQIQQSQMGMQKEQQAIGVGNEQIIANTLGPIAEEALQTGDQEAYRRKVGMAMAELGKQNIKPPVNFQPEQHDPMFVLTNSVGRGYKSPWYDTYSQVMKEQQMSQVAPRMSPEQAYGRVDRNPATNAPERVPGIMPPRQGPMSSQYGPAPESSQYEVMQSGQTLPTATGITPEQLASREEAMSEGREKGKQNVERRVASEDKATLLASLPTDAEVKALLDESIAGVPEAILKGPVATALHLENKAQTATNVLGGLKAAIKPLAEKAKGDLNMQEVRDLNAAMGALNDEDLTAGARYAGYVTAINIVRKSLVSKYPDLAEKAMSGATPAGAPAIGTVEDGHEFLGGDPANPKNWRAK